RWMKLLTWGSIPARRWTTTITNYLSASRARSESSPTSSVRCNSQAKTIKSFSTHSPRREIDQRIESGRLTGTPAMSAIGTKRRLGNVRFVKIVGEFRALMCKRDRTDERDARTNLSKRKGRPLRQRDRPFHLLRGQEVSRAREARQARARSP